MPGSGLVSRIRTSLKGLDRDVAWVFLVSALVTLPVAGRLLRLDPAEAIGRP